MRQILIELRTHELKLLGVKNRMKFQRKMMFHSGVVSRIVVSKLVYVFCKRCSTGGTTRNVQDNFAHMQNKIK